MLKHYIEKEITISNLKDFCNLVIANEMPGNRGDRISVRFLLLPFPANGYLSVRKKNNAFQYKVVINLLPFLIGKYSSNRMCYLYLYATIVHELHHIYLLERKKARSYTEFLAFWEEFRQLSSLRCVDNLNTLLMHKDAFALNTKKHDISIAEILCNLSGFQRIQQVFAETLNESERMIVEEIIDSLKFLSESINIGYRTSKQPYNLFTKTIQEVQFILRKDPHIFEKPTPIDCLFLSNGQVKPFELIFGERSPENHELIDALLINWFICIDVDFSTSFAANAYLKSHIEALANQYCNNVVQYLKHETKGLVFLSKDTLQDNTAMMIKNTNRINALMTKYGMTRTDGSIIPLYFTGK